MENKLISDYIKLLDQIFLKIKRKIGNGKVAVLASGGIDSSIITYFVKKYFNKSFLFSVGTADNADFYFVDLLNKFIKNPLKKIFVSESEVNKAKKIVMPILEKNNLPDDITQISLAISFFLVLKEVKKQKIDYVFTGQGPDILLAGYHKYKNIPLDQLNTQIKKDLSLLEIDKKRDQTIANHFKIKLINPYLKEDFINFSLSVPDKFKINKIDGEFYEKYILRKVGERLKLPKEIILRHKKALQYSTGIRKILS